MLVSAETRETIEQCYENGWTDGLPVVPCTSDMLAEFLATTDRSENEEVVHFRGVNRSCTVRDAAINAAMAGCRPEYFPVVLAAWAAIDADGWASIGLLQSTSGSTPLLIVNGPVRHAIELNSSGNVFGSGFRANATIGRAIRLTVINVFGIRPHVLDQSTQGQPARYSACIGENEEASPWPSMHEDHGFGADESTVTAMSLRSVSHIEARHTRHPEQLLCDVADSIARTGNLLQATTSACVIFSPEHAHVLAEGGWSKGDVTQFLMEHTRVSRSRLIEVGKSHLSHRAGFRVPSDHPDATSEAMDEDQVPVLADRSSVHIVVSGASNAGVSAVANLYGVGTPPQPVRVV